MRSGENTNRLLVMERKIYVNWITKNQVVWRVDYAWARPLNAVNTYISHELTLNSTTNHPEHILETSYYTLLISFLSTCDAKRVESKFESFRKVQVQLHIGDSRSSKCWQTTLTYTQRHALGMVVAWNFWHGGPLKSDQKDPPLHMAQY